MGPTSATSGTARAVLVLLVGALATLALSTAAWSVHRSSERDMLDQRSDEVVKTLGAVLPLFQVPLGSGLAVATVADQPRPAFERVVAPFVTRSGLVHSASLWQVGPQGARRLATTGERSTLERLTSTERLRRLRALPTGSIGIVDLTGEHRRAVGFAEALPGTTHLVAYLEAPIPDDPTSLDLTGNAFSDLDIEVHLGPGRSPRRLLFATTRHLPLPASAPTKRIPWGDHELVLAFAPRGDLGDPLLARLPLLIAATGLTMAVAFAVLTHQLERSRQASVRLAGEHRERYLQERQVAHRLQHDLLPDPLPTPPGVVLASRYQAGADGVEIGGDWYDVVPIDDDHVIVTVGDVSGQGLPAASIMVSLRAAIRAYATDGAGPGEILHKLGRLLDVRADGHFATVLCACDPADAGEVVVATAGHPPPVLAGPTGAHLVALDVGLPVGVSPTATYAERTIALGPNDTLVCFTDGLFERRGERLDLGLERVREVLASLAAGPIDRLVEQLTDQLEAPAAPDDTAVLAVRLAPQAGRASASTRSESTALAAAP
ncbi:MAG: PP2C family protein-serine/threonine phosphatase [Acidimicrobiales bacterium]